MGKLMVFFLKYSYFYMCVTIFIIIIRYIVIKFGGYIETVFRCEIQYVLKNNMLELTIYTSILIL